MFAALLPGGSREANPVEFHSANTPTSWDPGKPARVKELPGRLILAAAQLTCANTATGTGKALEGVEKHQTLGR